MAKDKSARKDKSPKVPQGEKIKDGFHIEIPEWTDKQKQIINAILDKNTRIVFINGPAGTGKAQPLDSKILTPRGWVLMQDIKIGDKVFAANGDVCSVNGIYPQGEKDIYEVVFSDGSRTKCCDEHLWATQNYKERNHKKQKELPSINNKRRRIGFRDPLPPQIRSLAEIKNNLTITAGGINKANYSIDLVEPLNFIENQHYIHPYAMGVLIGDGCFRHSISFTSIDKDIIDKMKILLPQGLKLVTPNNSISFFVRKIHQSRKPGFVENPYKEEIKRLGLFNRLSYEKFIPKEYLFDSLSNRIELLRGLMDTDGTTNGIYHSYSTVSPQLVKDVVFLTQSLGGTAIVSPPQISFYTYNGEKRRGRDSYKISIKLPNEINPFFLKRKAEKVIPHTKYFPIRYFKKVNYVGKALAQCISIDHPSHLYVTDDCIVTHNTYIALYAALELLRNKRASKITYVRTAVESAEKSIGFLPGEADDKIAPYARPLLDKLEEFLQKPTIEYLTQKGFIGVDLINFLRGASLNVQVLVGDEFQNANFKEITTVLTRLGKYSKFIICGDTMQSDINGKSGFFKMLNVFNDEESKKNGIHVFNLDKSDIMRSEELKFILEKIEQAQ